MWSNYISYILAKVINFCFDYAGGTNLEQRSSAWRDLDRKFQRGARIDLRASAAFPLRQDPGMRSYHSGCYHHGTVLSIGIKFGVSMLIIGNTRSGRGTIFICGSDIA
jgi:hypothetical protein